MTNPLWILDLETTGLISGYGSPRPDVGIAEWALLPPATKKALGGHTDIILNALSTSKTPQDYYKQITSGKIAWQSGVSRPGDVLAGVHENLVTATRKALESGSEMSSESAALRAVKDLLIGGKQVGGWNIGFDIGILHGVAERHGDKDFFKLANRAFAEGRIVEMSDPARKFLFDLARTGSIELGHSSKVAKAKISRGEWGASEITGASTSELWEKSLGFEKLFKLRPDLSYEDYKREILESAVPFDVQEFAAGQTRPEMRMMRGWRQQVIAEAINPGYAKDPTATRLGQEVAKRVGMDNVKAHVGSYDVGLSAVLHDIFATDDPWKALKSFGVTSRDDFIANYKRAVDTDLRSYLMTYLGERATHSADNAYFRKVFSGARMSELKATAVAEGAARQGMPGLKNIFGGALQEVKDLAYKHPRASIIVGAAAALAFVDALIPQDNRLEGRRTPNSQYTSIRGIRFDGISSPANVDFGSGRDQQNASSAVQSAVISRSYVNKPWKGFSVAEIEKAQSRWSTALSNIRRRSFQRSEYLIKKSPPLSGVNQDAWTGVVDLRKYQVKAEDADTVTIHRRGLMRLFDRPISVRLQGVDAPEVHPNGPFGGQYGGLASGEYLQRLIDQQNSLHLVFDPNRSTYGRHLGVLVGDVDPNINLKLVSSGAAAALPPRETKSVVNKRAFEKAEMLAAHTGIGIWSSKGWQAKRMLDLAESKRISNVTLMSAKRVADEANMSGYFDFVQHMHDEDGSWKPSHIAGLYSIMSSRRSNRLTQTNNNIKRYGWDRGIRTAPSTWGIVGGGITASDSEFGSGWNPLKAEIMLRKVDPLRTKLFPLAEPMMLPSIRKSSSIGYFEKMADRVTAVKLIAPSIHLEPEVLIPTFKPPEIKSVVLESSAAATARSMSSSINQSAYKEKYLGAIYSAHSALHVPWKPLNEYKAVHGWGFPGGWQEKAWDALRSGDVKYGPGVAPYSDMLSVLRSHGFTKSEAHKLLGRYWNKPKPINKIEAGTKGRIIQAINRRTAPGTFIGALFDGDFGYWWDRSKLFMANRAKQTIGTAGVFGTLKADLELEFRLRKVLWNETVTKKTGKLGKVGGFLEFLMDAGHQGSIFGAGTNPLVALTPENWSNFATERKGIVKKTAEWLRGPAKESAELAKIKGWVGTNASKIPGASSFGKGFGKAARKIGGPLGFVFVLPGVLSAGEEYKNSFVGVGVETAAGVADFIAFETTFGSFTAAGMLVGRAVGTAIGGLVGTIAGAGAGGVGAVPGAGAGAGFAGMIGQGVGWVVGAAASMFASQLAGEAIRTASGPFAPKRNVSPYPQDPSTIYGPQIPGMDTDPYLASHGVTGSDYSGFGSGLKLSRESRMLGEILSGAGKGTLPGTAAQAPKILRRPRSRLQPTAGLSNVLMWENRHGNPRSRSKWPVQWKIEQRPARHHNQTRMLEAA